LKKLKNKQRKQQKKLEKEKEKQKEQEKKDHPNKKQQDQDQDGPKEEELVPDKLAKVSSLQNPYEHQSVVIIGRSPLRGVPE
jgi:peptide alpha-N-acetyltransferase